MRGWRVTFTRWQNWQSLDQWVMSVDMPVHTHLANMRRLVALTPGLGQCVDGSKSCIPEWRRQQPAGCYSLEVTPGRLLS